MPLPSGIQTITVTGKFLDSFGNPESGSVTFTPPPTLIDPATAILYAKPTSANLDATGSFTVTLVCTDNPSLVPVGWHYTVIEDVGGSSRSYPIYVPHTLGASVDLSTVTPIPTQSGTPALIPSGTVAPGYGGLAYNQTWTGSNTFTGAAAFSGPFTLDGVAITGTPAAGQVLAATASNAATWQSVAGVSGVQLGGDIAGTNISPQVTSTHLASPLPLAQGGTNASNAAGARTQLGLGSAAVANVDITAADIAALGTQAAGAVGQVADAGHVHPMPRLDQVLAPQGAVGMGSQKITSLAAGVAATDGANVGQLPVASGTVAPQTAYGQSSTVGTSAAYAHGDHTHGTPPLTSTAPATTLGIGTAAALGTATLPALADHVHPMAAAGSPSTSAVGDSAVTGVATTFAASDHKHAREGFAAPGSSAVGDAAAAGTSTSLARADHTHGRESFGAVTALSAFNVASANGTAATVARSDHVHGAPALPAASTSVAGIVQLDGVPADIQPLGTLAAGATGKAADAGHVHPYDPWRFSVTAYGAKGDGQCSATGSVTSGSNIVTIGETKFSSADVGKLIMVKFAVTAQGSAGQSTAVGTITGYTNATTITASFTAGVTGSALNVFWATDDTSAIQSAIAAANTYAVAHGLGEIFFPAPAGLFYGVGGALKFSDGTNSIYNSQLTIPLNSEQNPGVTLVFRGTGDNGQARYWSSDFPAFNGGIVSFGVFTSQAAQASTDTHSVNNGGNPSVIGGPTGKWNYGVLQGANTAPTYSNTCVVFQDFAILTTHSASGWTYSAANMFGVARFHARNFSYGTTGVVQYYKNAPGLGDFATVSTLASGASVGLLMPSNGNNASNYLQNVVCNGGYTYALFAMEHTVGNDVTILYCWSGLCPVGNYNDSAGSGTVSALHATFWDQVCIESCTYHVNIIGAGSSGVGPIIHAVMDTEGTVQLRDGTTNNGTGLSAAMGEIRLTGSSSTINVTVGTGTGSTGGTGLRIIKEQTLPGVPSSSIPTLTANTAVSNTLWRPATVYLVGGTNLTTIQVSRLAGGVSSVPLTTVADFTTAGTISAPFPVRLGPGQWIKINTSSGTTIPTATWVLD